MPYTNASCILKVDYQDAEERDGFFSGWDESKRAYSPASWLYEGDDLGHLKRDLTLQHPRCVFQVLKRHPARYTPEMVHRITGCPPELFLRVLAGAEGRVQRQHEQEAGGVTQIVHWEAGSGPQWQADELAPEEPLEIQVDARSICVTMRTPGHDEELAAGFLLSEGLIHRRRDLAAVEPYWRNKAGNVLGVFLSPEVRVDYARLTRHVFASSSCGLCGKASIYAVHQSFPPVTKDLCVSGSVLAGLPDQLRQAQEVFERTGGLHAAAVFTTQGQLVVLREDVGRHNAVDKVLGYGLLQNLLPFDQHVLMVSGRSSFEILQKALAGRIPIVAAVSAPSSLAVQFAQASGQTLVGFLRGERMNVYSRAERVRFA